MLDALRPRVSREKLWQWRNRPNCSRWCSVIPKEVNADRVHLHLEHPLVMRLLNRFLMRGFQSDALSRAAVIATHDDTAKLIVLARLSLYGHRAARLHDEVLALAAEWDPADPARRLRKLSVEKTGRAMAIWRPPCRTASSGWRASASTAEPSPVATSTNCVRPWSRKWRSG